MERNLVHPRLRISLVPACPIHDTPMQVSVVYQTTVTFRCWACKAQKLDTMAEVNRKPRR